MPSRARRCGATAVMSRPRQAMVPRLTRVKPMMVSRSVVLPTPLRPSSARLPPSGISNGGRLALLGRNGVGKTTLLLTIMGFTRVSREAPPVRHLERKIIEHDRITIAGAHDDLAFEMPDGGS